MRKIGALKIKKAAAELAKRANFFLRKDVLAALRHAYAAEKNKRAKNILKAILDNAAIAAKKKLAICQDTGMPCVFVELGQEVRVEGDLNKAINSGIEEGYTKGYFRRSIIKDPLSRGRSGYLPALIHIDIVPGNKLKLTVLPKGFGCENKAQLKMFNPTAKIEDVKKFIIDAVRSAGPDACPPYVVGVGIGGTADYAVYLAKKALLDDIYKDSNLQITDYGCEFNPGSLGKLEDLPKEINRLNIGPMGLGGKNTVLAVNIHIYPTHIAGLPVAVNISCHALRSASVVL